MEQSRPFPIRDFGRYAPFGIVGGATIGFLISGFTVDIHNIAHGALIGFSCYAAAMAADHFFQPWLDRKPEAWWRRVIVYFAATQLAWPIALFAGVALFRGVAPWRVALPRGAIIVAVVLGVAGTALGFGIYLYEQLKERLRVSMEQLKEKEIAEKELELARAFQARLLPAPDVSGDGYRITARNLPARYVAGDFYDVFHYADGAVGIAVADVAGKGVAASLVMASVKAVLPLLASTRTIDDALVALNEKLVGELARREFVALSLARFEPRSGRVTVANAGLPDPYVVRAGGEVAPLEVPGPRLPLGLKRSIAYEKFDSRLEAGEALILFSDGLPEATTHSGEQLGYDGLVEIIRTSGAGADAIMQRIQSVEAGPRDDDQTLVVIERL